MSGTLGAMPTMPFRESTMPFSGIFGTLGTSGTLGAMPTMPFSESNTEPCEGALVKKREGTRLSTVTVLNADWTRGAELGAAAQREVAAVGEVAAVVTPAARAGKPPIAPARFIR